jgi:hypothetical protein
VQWLTAALENALERRSAVVSRRGDRVYGQAAVIALAQVRHRCPVLGWNLSDQAAWMTCPARITSRTKVALGSSST